MKSWRQGMENILDIGPLPQERLEAISNDYREIWTITIDGRFRCLSCPSRFYNSTDLNITKIYREDLRLTIYIISTIDGDLKGTAYRYKAK